MSLPPLPCSSTTTQPHALDRHGLPGKIMDAPRNEFLPFDARNYFKVDRSHDDRRVMVRSIQPHDKPYLQDAFSELSRESIYFRFFRIKTRLTPRELRFYTELDFVNHVSLGVGLIAHPQPIPMGVGSFIRNVAGDDKLDSAELALTVHEKFQGMGVGTILLRHLIHLAKSGGLTGLEATLLDSNTRMLSLLRKTGMLTSTKSHYGIIEAKLCLR